MSTYHLGVDKLTITEIVTPKFVVTPTSVGLFGATPVSQQVVPAFTNNVTAGGSPQVLEDIAGVLYATDAPGLRNNCYQLGEQVKKITIALRALGVGV